MSTSKYSCIPLLGETRRAALSGTGKNSDRLAFFQAWAANPLQVASIMPSGTALSELITSEISSETGPVIELGPGTGVFTRALLVRGVKERNLTLIEFGSEFVSMLQARFPEARVVRMDAQRVGNLSRVAGQSVGAVVSGLPLLSMSSRKVMGILAGSFRHLGERGRFYQFTYGPSCPVPRRILDRLGLKAVRIGWTSQNIPPASVYRISRRRALA